MTVAGCGAAELNGLHVLQAAEDDWVLVPALCRTLDSQTAAVTVMRLMPEMDFVVEQGNRLWGCKYGIVDGQAVNEIYALSLIHIYRLCKWYWRNSDHQWRYVFL